MRDYRTDGRTDGQTDAGQSDPYVPLCFAGDTKTLIPTENSTQRRHQKLRLHNDFGPT